MPDSNQNVTPIADLNSIGSWTKADYASLTADFISQMTTPQIKLMQHPEWVTGKAVSGFTAEHIPVLVVDFYNVTGEWLNNLNDEATKAITPAQMTRLTFYNLCNLDSHHLGQLTAAQVAGINDNYQWYSSTWLNSLTPEAFKGIPINKLNQIKLADFSLLHPDHIKAISSANLDALNDAHLKALTAEQVAAIPALSSLSSDQFGLLNISGLSNAAIHNLSQTQRSGVTAQQVSTLSNEQVSELQSLNGMSVFSAAGFTKEQIPHISMNFFYFAPAWYDNLTTEAFQAITPAQIGQIYEAGLEGMGAKRRAELTKEQVAAITVNFYFLSSDWLNSLSTEAVKGITAKQLNQIQAGTFKGMDNAHLSALTVEQVAAASHLSSLSSNQFGLLDISGLSTSSIANLSQTEYAGLTTKQFSSLSTEQIQAMTHAQWLPDAVIGKLTVTQTVALGDHLAQLTAAQVVLMNHLQDLTSTQFGLLNISGLSVSTLASLTTTEYAGLTAKQIAAMSAEQINALQHVELLPVAAMSGFTAAQMPALSDNVLSHLSADQVAAMTQLSALSSVQFGLLNISKFSEAAINGLSQAEYEGITALQISTLTPLQIHAMWHTSWMSDDTALAFTPEQVKSISIHMYYFTAGWLNNLPLLALQALKTDQLNDIDVSTLDDKQLSGLTAEQVGSINNLSKLSSSQFGLLNISGLSTSAISKLSQTEYAGLTTKQFSSLSTEQIQAMTHAQWLPDAVIGKLTVTQTVALGDHLAQLTAAQVVLMNHLQDLTSTQFGLLNISGLSVSSLASLTTTEYAGLTAKQIAAMSAEQINALQHVELLPVAAMSGFTAAQMPALSDNVLSHFSAEQVAAMTQLSALSSVQFGLLNISKFSEAAINGLSQAEYEGITALQISTLTPLQIHAMWHTSWMSDATASTFTTDQVKAINISMGYFTAGWLNNLSIEALQALTPAQTSQISSATLATLDNEHLHALTAEQIGGMNNFGGLSSAQFGLLDISKMQTSVISNFSDTEYKGLTANQIATLSAEQINSMGHAAWMRDDAASGFTPEQIRNCTQDFYWFSPGWLNSLSKEAFQAIKPENIRQMYRDALVGLDAERRSQLTAEQIAGEHYNFYFFSSVWFNSLSPEAMKGITAEHFTQIQESNFKKWDNEHLAALTATQVATIPYLNALTSDQFGYLDISGLPVSAIEALSKTEYQGLTAKQIASLSAEQIKSLKHLGWISEAALKGFTANQMQAFGNDLSGFTAALLNNLSVDAFNALTAAQLNSLDPVAFTGMDYQHVWALGHFSELTGLLSSLTNDQLLTISQMLTMEQQSVLSEEQKALINKSVDTGFSLVDSVHDPILKISLHNAVTNDASVFSFTTIESVLKDFASQLTGDLTESQYNDIKNYVQHVGDVCGTDSAVYSLLNGLIGTNGASVYWSATGDGQRIGSLNVGSSVTQFNQLISTWFDGANDPKNSSSDHVDGRPVFAKGGPTINDIQQGSVSDCSLLSALQAVVETAPDFIKSMIVQNPNDTYSVRFFKDGVPHWVTVDGNVDGSGTSSANSSWGAIIERAVVDFEATYLNEVNDYSSLPAGFGKLKEITGDTYTTLRAVYTSEDAWDTTDFDLLKTAVLNGQPVQLSSWESSKNADTGQTNLVGGHAFAIIGFDDVTNDFILANPWGAFRKDNVQGTFEASMDQMWQHGNSNTGIAIVNSNGVSDAAGQLVHAMAAMNTSPSAALTTAALPVNVNNNPLAASHA